MLTRFIKIQLVLFTILTIIALVVLGWYYLRLPSVAGIGQYKLYADLPRSGGLYATANVTYRGTPIGKVTGVEPTERGARATMSIDNQFKIPVDASANVHSVSAIGEQYLDLVSTGNPGQYFSRRARPSPRGTVPSEVGPGAGRRQPRPGGAAEGEDRRAAHRNIASGRRIGPGAATAGRLHDQRSRRTSRTTCRRSTTSSTNSAPILDSQVNSGDAIEQWARNLNIIAAQTAEQDQALRSGLQQAAPTPIR